MDCIQGSLSEIVFARVSCISEDAFNGFTTFDVPKIENIHFHSAAGVQPTRGLFSVEWTTTG